VVTLTLQTKLPAWKRIPRLRSHLQKAAEATWAHLPARFQLPCEVGVLLTGDAGMRRLNRDFRGIDKPTNVLSFPEFGGKELSKLASYPPRAPTRGGHDAASKIDCTYPIFIGDIALGYQYIVVEAKKDHKILKNHLSHLMIHGILHLFGYDHIHDKDASRMERLEKKIMVSLGLPDPYQLTTRKL
jgi:probable rRNA maturation factor